MNAKITINNTKINCKLLQTQLITGRYKAKVYYCDIQTDMPVQCHDIKGNTVNPIYPDYGYILKTPLSKRDIDAILLSNKIKQILHLKSDYPIQINKDSILSINYCQIDDSNYVIKSSKLETNVKIYNGNKYSYNSSNISKCPLDVFINLLFRKIIGTNDTVDRNFILTEDTFMSIDDPAYFVETNYMFKVPLAKKYINDYLKYFDICWGEIIDLIFEWHYLIVESDIVEKDFILKQLDKYSEKDNWEWT